MSTNTSSTIKFRDGDETLTLWVEKTVYESGADTYFMVGWCPERQNNMVVHAANIAEEAA